MPTACGKHVLLVVSHLSAIYESGMEWELGMRRYGVGIGHENGMEWELGMRWCGVGIGHEKIGHEKVWSGNWA